MARNREALERSLVEIKEALESHDDALIQSRLGKFARTWEKDGATYQFYDGDLMREFAELSHDYYSNTSKGIILSSDNMAVIRVLPQTAVREIVTQIMPGQDDNLVGNLVQWLERNKDYASLVQAAGLSPAYFDEIQSIIIGQKDDLNYMLEFMKKYGNKADVKAIMTEARDYMGQVRNKKSGKRTYDRYEPCWDEIYTFGKGLLKEDKDPKTKMNNDWHLVRS